MSHRSRSLSLSLSPYAQVATAANNNKRSAAVMVRFEFFFVSAGKTSLFRSFRFVRVNLGARAPLEFEMIYYYGLCLLSSSFATVLSSCFFPERKVFILLAKVEGQKRRGRSLPFESSQKILWKKTDETSLSLSLTSLTTPTTDQTTFYIQLK